MFRPLRVSITAAGGHDHGVPFADELLGADAAATLTRSFQAAVPAQSFEALALASASLSGLALRERTDLLRDALLADLPGPYAEFAAVVRSARNADAGFSGWLIWPVTSAVAVRAVQDGSPEAFADGMALLAELTELLTSEWALRAFLRHDPERAIEITRTWVDSENEHVRRLASEGTRPFLPWGVRVPTLDPVAAVSILNALYRDESEYVRRSVANHLNDLSRINPDLVVTIAEGWLSAPADTTPALVRHALRTLVKAGNPGALALLGFGPASVEVDGPVLSRDAVAFSGEMRFTATIRNVGVKTATLAIDYIVFHQKANGTQTSKTFKLATRSLAPGEVFDIERVHSFRPITTRRYYPGAHGIALQVNGVATEPVAFGLLPPD